MTRKRKIKTQVRLDDDDTESKHDWKSLDRKLRERIPE